MHSGSPHSAGIANATQAARAYRHSICTLAYVRLDHANGGIIRNLNESGMGIQAVGRLHPEQVVHLRFEFIRPRAKFELVGQVAWADQTGQAGLRFTDLPLRTRRQLKEWMFTDLLAASHALKTGCPVLNGGQTENALVISSLPMNPIELASSDRNMGAHEDPEINVFKEGARLTVPWWPISIGQNAFRRFIDSMVVFSAMLLFSIIVVELTDALPSWPVLVGIEMLFTAVFALLYRYLAHLVIGCSLGTHLAELAADEIARNPISSLSDTY
ncbi:MAG: PilZ domain-containing protein [Acidobacteria bacterium]|nr:PilZ domain-containing protein [Acidobacteriota bacterium]